MILSFLACTCLFTFPFFASSFLVAVVLCHAMQTWEKRKAN